MVAFDVNQVGVDERGVADHKASFLQRIHSNFEAGSSETCSWRVVR
jgi:hypothetical protein